MEISANYYDDLAARLDLAEDYVATLQARNILYDEDEGGAFVAANGPAAGMLSTPIGVAETPSAVGNSLQLEDAPGGPFSGLAVQTLAGSYVWENDAGNPATPGALNSPQTVANPVEGVICFASSDVGKHCAPAVSKSSTRAAQVSSANLTLAGQAAVAIDPPRSRW